MTQLKSIDYGKSRVRVAKINRRDGHHDFSELTVAIRLQGNFEASYLAGDNSLVIPTDTMKNTVYGIAAGHDLNPPEAFGQTLCQHFLATHNHIVSARVVMESPSWSRIDPFTFEHGQAVRLAEVEATRDAVTVHAGLDNLVLLKTTKSSFEGYLRDRFTTLKETSDRIFATSVRAYWRYATPLPDFNAAMNTCRAALVKVFADHDSRAVQETLYAMGSAVLAAVPEVAEIRLTLPNKHYLPVNLEPLGLENRNEIFLPTDEPHGLIEATIAR
jgi:urate oxidase